MPVGEMCARMSAEELTVAWPRFFRWEAEERQRDEIRSRREG
jgi:hypothetical protein